MAPQRAPNSPPAPSCSLQCAAQPCDLRPRIVPGYERARRFRDVSAPAARAHRPRNRDAGPLSVRGLHRVARGPVRARAGSAASHRAPDLTMLSCHTGPAGAHPSRAAGHRNRQRARGRPGSALHIFLCASPRGASRPHSQLSALVAVDGNDQMQPGRGGQRCAAPPGIRKLREGLCRRQAGRRCPLRRAERTARRPCVPRFRRRSAS
jgi:hypothetical protein